jgi:predicted TIM-barrel fold metal-dependent hydrolase
VADGLIDAWAQPAEPGFLQKIPEVERLFRMSGVDPAIFERGIGPDEMVASMDAAGIEKALLCAWCRPEGWLIRNDRVAEFVAAHPDRFVGVAAVDLSKPMEALHELERAVRDLGFKALRVVPWLWELPPTDRRYYPLYMKCIELDVPFCTQVGHTGPLKPNRTGVPLELDEVALDFPELRIVGGHIGHPWTEEMIAVAWKHENVSIDTSAYLPRYYPPQLLHFIRTFGKDKVMFGTNFPQLSFEKCAEQARALDLPEEPRARFFRENAERVFRLDTP